MLISNILGVNSRKVIAFSLTFTVMFSATPLTTSERDSIDISEKENSRVVEVSTKSTPIKSEEKFRFVCISESDEVIPTAKELLESDEPILEEIELEEATLEAQVLEVEPIIEETEEPVEVISEPLTYKALYESYVDEICAMYQNVPSSIIKAMIERESNWDPNCCSDGGDSCGLMQIQPKWHADMMASLGVEDIFDPYGNILVGVNLFSGLLNEYPAIEWALMCYNAGPYYGTLNYKNGQISSYAASIIARAEEIEGGG